jgi:phenylacetate-CoA ligase
MGVKTTGSSGFPLEVKLSAREYATSLSFVLYGFLAAGASYRDTFVHIHALTAPAKHYAFERFGVLRQLHLDLRAGEKATLDALRQVRSPVVYSFPSFLRLMADFVLEQNLPPPAIRLIVCNGEILTTYLRARIQEAFRCPVYDSYGAAESFRIAFECRRQKLHIIPDAAIVEVDEHTKAPDGSADILVTPLYLRAMPLIRYRLGDRVRLSNDGCSCGLSWPIISTLVGRSDDHLTLPGGRKISPRAVNLLEAVTGIREYQILQRTYSDFLVRVKPSTAFSDNSRAHLIEIIAAGCSPDRVNVEIETVDFIPRSATGKLKSVVSQVN